MRRAADCAAPLQLGDIQVRVSMRPWSASPVSCVAILASLKPLPSVFGRDPKRQALRECRRVGSGTDVPFRTAGTGGEVRSSGQAVRYQRRFPLLRAGVTGGPLRADRSPCHPVAVDLEHRQNIQKNNSFAVCLEFRPRIHPVVYHNPLHPIDQARFPHNCLS
jgi:hypothetical protein